MMTILLYLSDDNFLLKKTKGRNRIRVINWIRIRNTGIKYKSAQGYVTVGIVIGLQVNWPRRTSRGIKNL